MVFKIKPCAHYFLHNDLYVLFCLSKKVPKKDPRDRLHHDLGSKP